jgi:hypothetical protein
MRPIHVEELITKKQKQIHDLLNEIISISDYDPCKNSCLLNHFHAEIILRFHSEIQKKNNKRYIKNLNNIDNSVLSLRCKSCHVLFTESTLSFEQLHQIYNWCELYGYNGFFSINVVDVTECLNNMKDKFRKFEQPPILYNLPCDNTEEFNNFISNCPKRGLVHLIDYPIIGSS